MHPAISLITVERNSELELDVEAKQDGSTECSTGTAEHLSPTVIQPDPTQASNSLPMSPQMNPADMREPVLRTSSSRLMRKPVHVREDI